MFAYDFIEKIGRIEIKHSTKFRKKYITFTEEFESEEEYNQKLDEYFCVFKKQILSLPFNLNSKQSRKAFINNLHDEFLNTKLTLREQFGKVISESYDCITTQRKSFRCCFPRYFQKMYLTHARTAYQKIHIVYTVHKDKIENAVDILKSIALNDGFEINVLNENTQERIRTNLSSPELSYLFFLIFKTVSEDKDFNRSNLARLIANNFSTKKTLSPQATQIRKNFTEVSDNVKSKVEKLLTEISESA